MTDGEGEVNGTMAKEPRSYSAGEIHEWLDRIDARIGKADPAVLHKELDEIFQYKPVDNHYFLVRGKLYFQEGKYHEVDMALAAKENWWVPSPWAPLMMELMYENRKATGAGEMELSRNAIIGYYVCGGAMIGERQDRRIHYHDSFVKMTEEVYRKEAAEAKRLEKALSTAAETGTVTGQESVAEPGTATGLESAAVLADSYWKLLHVMQCTAAKMAAAGKVLKLEEQGLPIPIEHVLMIEPNLGYFVRRVAAGREDGPGFLLIVSSENRAEQYVMARLLKAAGCRCTILELPITVDLDYMVDIRETVEISLSNREEKDGVEILYPCALFLNDEFTGDNVAEIIDALLERTEDCYIDIIADRDMFSGDGFHCLTEYKGEFFKNELCFGYAGDYAAYLSHIFSYDYRKQLGRESKCRFSIIIPARNSAYTLQYTLRTCLNQRSMEADEYEIIISDNSDPGNTEIEALVRSLGDDKIKYFKTPMALPLAKSFEYAYGMAQGEYILTLGSDDGLLPWCLEVLREMSEKHPEQDVIGWGRGFFIWTESKISEHGKLVIPEYFRKGEYNEYVFNSLRLLKERLDQDGEEIYAMPLIYINSVCKRKFLLELLDKSGTLLDSYTQDLGMGLKVLLFAGDILYLNYSLSIAGMSDGSLGAKMAEQITSDEKADHRLQTQAERGAGATVMQAEVPFWPVTTTEGMFWAEIFRLRANSVCGAILERLLEDHDWKKTLCTLAVTQNVGDVGCFSGYEKMRYSAYGIGEEIGQWYDGALYPLLSETEDRKLQELKDSGFATGFIDNRRLVLDAGKFGVKNIEEAVELFANITNL